MSDDSPFTFKYDIYLAGPFFNDQQRTTMDIALANLRGLGFEVFNPREHGPVLVNVPIQERSPAMLDAIVQSNIDGLDDSFCVVACIDDRDTGTAWELGYGKCNSMPLFTFSGFGYGANIMLSRTVNGHFPSIEFMIDYMKLAKEAIKAQSSPKLPPVGSQKAESEN